jgi:hypothetical protein
MHDEIFWSRSLEQLWRSFVARRKRYLIAVFPFIVVILWCMLTTPFITKTHVEIEFSWNEREGFTSIRTMSGLAKLDPPFDKLFTNPLVTSQAKRPISLYCTQAGWKEAKGIANVPVYTFMIVSGHNSHEGWVITGK